MNMARELFLPMFFMHSGVDVLIFLAVMGQYGKTTLSLKDSHLI